MHRPLLSLGCLALAAGCALAREDAGSSGADLRPVERAIVGAALPYPADTGLRSRTDELAGSQRARREAAWAAALKILAPTSLAEPGVAVDASRPLLPAFRTWYQKDDLERIFARAYAAHGRNARRQRLPFSPSELDDAFAWNATDRGGLSDDEYLARVAKVTTASSAQGLGGNQRVSYSPAALRHVVASYAALSRCARGEVADDPNAAPASPSTFTTCLETEFPADAALVKASWLRADFDLTVPIRPTTPEVLAARMAGTLDDGGWGDDAKAQASPDPDSIYTVQMSDGATFRLPALHLVTKELRHWLWITLWWSPDPDTDFGADRPDAILSLPGPWKNYKMCVVTDFAEGDPDPTGGYPTGPGSLGDALTAVHRGAGGPTWCSNPYIERGAHDAQTNCIGCHQHAGTALVTEDILNPRAPDRFPESGRTLLRKNFPADYVFGATAPPESLAAILDARMQVYDAADGASSP